MDTQPTSPDEQTTKDELLFALHHRDKPTLAFVECKTNAKRDELTGFLAQGLPEYTFFTIDVTPLPVTSLLRTLADNLPDAIKNSPPVTCVVNVYGLENRLDEQLAAQLNLERELLFRNVPYITLIWADAYFFRKLQRLAPDLGHWVTYKFRFDDPTGQPIAQLPPLPPERLEQKGDIEARRERIRELEERYSHLDLSDNNKLRLLWDKLNTKSLLGAEYVESFEFPKAIAAYRDALGLEEQMRVVIEKESGSPRDTYWRGSVLFNLGTAYFKRQLFEEALNSYKQSKALSSTEAYGSIYHQIGLVYAEQNQWVLALDSYRQAIEWKQQTDSTSELGSTYHHIGMLYAEQKKWAAALENYEQAITWRLQTGSTFALGPTYHQIGMMYAEQNQWVLALSNYEQAVEWNQRTGYTFMLGNTYHQIGMVYAEQRQWEKAMENYELALKWKQQGGNTFELAGTYHQIGRLYEEQDNLVDALSWFEKTRNSAADHPNLPMAERSLARVQEKLRQRPA